MGASASCNTHSSVSETGAERPQQKQQRGGGHQRKVSRVDPVGRPIFAPEEGLTEGDVELMHGLNCHTAAYVVLGADDTDVLFVSESFERRTGIPASQAMGKAVLAVLRETMEVSDSDAKALTLALHDMADVVVPVTGKPAHHADVGEVCVQWYITPLRTGAGSAKYVLCALESAPSAEECRNEHSRSLGYRLRRANGCKQDEGTWTMFHSYKRLCEVDRLLVDTLQERGEMFCITDPALHDNPIVYVSDGFIDMTGYNRYEINGINCRFLQGHDTSPEDVDVIRTALKERKHARVCLLNYRKDGTRFINQFNISPLRDVDGELAYFIGVQMQVEDTEIMPFPNTRQSMAEMLVEAEREEMARSFEQVAN